MDELLIERIALGELKEAFFTIKNQLLTEA